MDGIDIVISDEDIEWIKTIMPDIEGELHSDMQLCNSKCSFVN